MIRRKTRRQRPNANAVMPPEGVPITLPVAPLGSRLAAQITDVLLTTLAMVAVIILLAVSEVLPAQTIGAVAALFFFFIRIPYYVVTELIWNGQTLGKRLMSLKVISHDGGPLTTHAIVLRNLMKEAEIFLPGTLVLTLDTASPVASIAALVWVIGGLLVPLRDPWRRRLGDFMAGTHVVTLPQPVLLPEVATAAPSTTARFTFLPHQLDHYGAYELQTLERLLRPAGGESKQDGTLGVVIEKIRSKIGYADPIATADHRAFLTAFYSAQREHLEQRQLFGDKRANKFHAQDDVTPAPQSRNTP